MEGRGWFMKRNGFVFVETIIVTAILLASLMLVYSLFVSNKNDETKRLRYDDTAKLYETYYLKQYFDSFDLSSITDKISDDMPYQFIYRGQSEIFGDQALNENKFFSDLWEGLGISSIVVLPYDLTNILQCQNRAKDICSNKDLFAYLNTLDSSEVEDSSARYRMIVEYSSKLDGSACTESDTCFRFFSNIDYVKKSKPEHGSFIVNWKNENEIFNYSSGMTFGDWLKSDYYPGEISGIFDSKESCENIWGENNGCQLTTYYYHIDTIYNYYSTLAKCQKSISPNQCEPISSPLYTYDVSLYFDFMDECIEYNDGSSDGCLYDNENEGYYIRTPYDYYKTYNECIQNGGQADTCYMVTDAYQYVESDRYEYNLLSECEEGWEVGNCMSASAYSPRYRANSIFSELKYEPVTEENDKDSILISRYGGQYYVEKSLDDVIENIVYECVDVCEGGVCGECVSPESDILSSNGKTIKAKNIKEEDEIAYYDFNTNQIKIGKVHKIFIHKNANSFVRYTFEDNTFLDVTDYHPIYTKDGRKSYTNRNGYASPKIGDLVKTSKGYKKLTKIEPSHGKEDYYDFQVMTTDGNIVNNYVANGVLVEGSY